MMQKNKKRGFVPVFLKRALLGIMLLCSIFSFAQVDQAVVFDPMNVAPNKLNAMSVANMDMAPNSSVSSAVASTSVKKSVESKKSVIAVKKKKTKVAAVAHSSSAAVVTQVSQNSVRPIAVESVVAAHSSSAAVVTQVSQNSETPIVAGPAANDPLHAIAVDPNSLNSADSQHYSGEKISLNFQTIPVRYVLQILAEFIHKNVIISDSVNGNMTLTLKDVPWDQVLAFVLKSQGLAKHETNNILIIAPAKELVAQEQADLTSTQALDALAPLFTQSFAINYGKVDDYYALLQDPKQTLLSSRGRVVKLNNSNTLIVDDTAKKLASIAALFTKMDQPAKQVLIEARIVYVNTAFQRNLGIKWALPGAGLTTGFNMDLSPPGMSSAGTNTSLGILQTGMTLGGSNLNLQLQAIESEGQGELVSSPRILTSNNMPGDIQQGQQIPYTTSAANGGTTVQFVQAILELKVTPQITPNNKLLLNISVTQNALGATVPGSTIPAIDTRQLTTMIMVNNGQTIVLGGIYDRTKTSTVVRLPWLSAIPLIGNLFKSKITVDNKDELLIFLTPKIIDVNENDAEFDV